MNKILCLLISCLFIIYSFTSCKNEKAELLYPPGVCDTIAVTYTATILPILRDNCYRCHAGNATVGPFNLDSYNDVSIYAANGQLWGSLAHLPGFSSMPKNTSQLSNCNLAKIKKWLNDGYPNN